MPIQARRVFRLSLTAALSLVAAYAMQLHLPFLAPIFALLLGLKPAPPPGPKKLLILLLVIPVTLGTGLFLTPLLIHYPLSGLLLVALGLYASFYLMVNKGKTVPGMFLAVGFTMISAAGTVSSLLSTLVIQSLAIGITLAILCQWLVYPLLPEDPAPAGARQAAAAGGAQSNWIALRGTLIVMPAYLLVLSNPAMYMPVIMKSVSLSQQSTALSVRDAGRELLGSTFLGGCFAIALWFLLGLQVNLWMFFLWVLLFTSFFAARIYGVAASRFPPSFWLNVATTLLILLGSAVMDSESGKDVYSAFFVRMGLFVLVTLYAWLAVCLLEYLSTRGAASGAGPESQSC
jgi:hypothetical protein